eukprot:m.247345 g.247345  ORF g.247345 m.247345 type:complete len:83 (-) comp15861_c1_seq1:5391-5639(-)
MLTGLMDVGQPTVSLTREAQRELLIRQMTLSSQDPLPIYTRNIFGGCEQQMRRSVARLGHPPNTLGLAEHNRAVFQPHLVES